MDFQQSPHIDALADALSERFGQRLRRNEPLAAHTTLRVGGPADLWLTITNPDHMVEAVTLAQTHRVPVFLLGSGANLLVSDRGVQGLVLQNRCQKVTFKKGDPPHAVVESGVMLPSLAHRLARRGLSGFEWAVGVPGTIGGAIVNNAGALGSSIADNLLRAELLVPEGERQWLPVNWFEYEYRSSRLKRLGAGSPGYFVVLQAELVFSRKSPVEIQNQMVAYNEKRKATQPSGASIGSMFKNPPNDYAGRLIEAAGLKGTQIGNAQISPVHANFFVNLGQATATDFVALIELAREKVKERFNVELELEIQRIGDWSQE